MNHKIFKAGLLSCSLFLLASCGGGGGGSDDASSSASAGNADLSTFVAVGDSLTAGFADGSLYFDGQLDSYPNILATSFAQAGGGTFNQPFVSDNLGGLLIGTNTTSQAQSRLVLNGNSPARQSENLMVSAPTTEVLNLGAPSQGALTGQGPFNNLGVPGARVTQLALNGFGDAAGLSAGAANPFYVRFNQVPGDGVAAIGGANPGQSLLEAAVAQNPTFFTLWIGNNDVLDFATSGGVNETAGIGSGQITPVATFNADYNNLVTNLTAGGAEGVLVNIPAITDIPFFTTVAFNPIVLPSSSAGVPDIATLNALVATYNGAVEAARVATTITDAEAAARTITFATGNNAPIIIDETLPVIGGLQVRQATANDAILLTTAAGLAAGNGLSIGGVSPLDGVTPLPVPLTDAQVLTASEIQLITTATAAYNATIQGLASGSSSLVLYDAAADLAQLNSGGINIGGSTTITSTFATGGAFSLDGVHPTAQGYAVIANGIIEAINDGFSANLNEADATEFSTVFNAFPAGTDFSVPAGFSMSSNGF